MTTRDDLLWFLDCSHQDEHAWYEVDVAMTYELVSRARRESGYRPIPLVMQEGWTNDVWYKPVFTTWETLLDEEVVSWEQELFLRPINRFEQAEIYQKRMLTP